MGKNKRRFGTIVQIGDILISEDVFMEYFSCDYGKCKGKCCIVGECGAPLDESELDELEKVYPVCAPLMKAEGRAAVDAKGFFEIDFEGDIVTPLIEGSQECAFCHFDPDNNCLCSIELSFLQGKCGFRKPISCSLYPIRIKKLTGGGLALNVHHWDICKDAFEKGKREGTRVYQFLQEPLTRMFGEEFYQDLCVAAKQVESSLSD